MLEPVPYPGKNCQLPREGINHSKKKLKKGLLQANFVISERKGRTLEQQSPLAAKMIISGLFFFSPQKILKALRRF